MQRKIITTNQSIKNYDFYKPNNILIIDEKHITFKPEFFNTPYEPIPESVYNKYTLSIWVNVVFDLKSE